MMAVEVKLVSDRKYRQRGYQDRPDKPVQANRGEAPPPKRDMTFGPRPLQMPGTRAVSRCAQCGTLLTSLVEPVGKCPKCGFELHSCKQCSYFDPSPRFECGQPVPERVPRKDVANSCTFFAIRVMLEKETSSKGTAKPNDARAAFENLFKK
jgi:hypothetical protein